MPPEKILEPHQEATYARIARHGVVLIVQDTTELDYSAHAPQGAGPLTSEKRLGFLDHSQIAFTPQGLCLGVVDVKIWARSAAGFSDSKKRQYDPLETKETFRWLEGYRRGVRSGAPDSRHADRQHLQLETFERLQRAIACYLVVAWRPMWLLYQSRQTPDRSGEGILETHEGQALHARARPREPLPDRPPTLREAVRTIAPLGGLLGRKGDGEPGLKTLWRGLRRLEDLALGRRLARRYRSPPLKRAG